MKRLVFISMCFIGAVALNGCSPTYPKCEKDEHCKTDGHDEVCVNGQCQECGRDGDCKDGFICRENACVPKPECESNADCGTCSRCTDEKCVPECRADDQCQEGMRCQGGCCVPKPECLSDADCATGMRCQSERCVEIPKPVCTLQTVLFDYNEHSLTQAARGQLDANAECIRTKTGVITLAGHADERGTEEYNLHLGEKRANSVKRYLQNLGVDASRLRTVSYGEERPANSGHDEGAWAENRRVEFTE